MASALLVGCHMREFPWRFNVLSKYQALNLNANQHIVSKSVFVLNFRHHVRAADSVHLWDRKKEVYVCLAAALKVFPPGKNRHVLWRLPADVLRNRRPNPMCHCHVQMKAFSLAGRLKVF